MPQDGKSKDRRTGDVSKVTGLKRELKPLKDLKDPLDSKRVRIAIKPRKKK